MLFDGSSSSLRPKPAAAAAAQLDAARGDADAQAEFDIAIVWVERIGQLRALPAATTTLTAAGLPQADAGHAQGDEARGNVLAFDVDNGRAFGNGISWPTLRILPSFTRTVPP